MKKILSTLSAAAMLVAAVALVGCSGAVQANPTDILEELEAPSVTAKAYPGFIRLTWDKVNGASQYKIYRNGELKATVNNGSKTAWNDVAGQNSNLINGKSYTYDVVAFAGDDYAFAQDSAAASSATNASARAVFVKQAKTTVTETANVPSVADFTENYKDYFEKFTAEDTALKTELVTVNNTNYIKVTAPTLPEFKYEVSINLDNTPANLISFAGLDAFEVESEDKTEFFRAVTSAGSYNVTVKVSPLSALYSAKEFKGSKAEVKLLTIDGDGTTNTKAAYTTSTKVRISWEPAAANSVAYTTTDYSVYRYDDGVYTKVAGDVAALNAGDINGSNVVTKKTYYIDDTVDASRPHQYHIVLGKDGLYEPVRWSSTTGSTSVSNANVVWPYNTLNQAGSVTASATYINEGKAVRVQFTPAKKDDTVAMYTVYRYLNSETDLVKLGALKSTTYASINQTGTAQTGVTYTTYFYVEDAVKDNTVNYTYKIYRTADDVTTEVAGNVPASAYSSMPSASTPVALTATATRNDQDLYNNDVWVTFRLGDNKDSFKLYRANTTNTPNPLDSDYAEVTGYAYASTTANYATIEYVLFDGNLAKGTYRYKLVESAAGKKDSVRTADVTVYATTGVSGFNVSWDSVNHKIIFSDSYNKKTETASKYTYSYQIVKKTTNNFNTNYIVADEAVTAITLADFGTAVGDIQSTKYEVLKSITANTTDTYQVIAVKTDATSGEKFYAVTSPVWVASN